MPSTSIVQMANFGYRVKTRTGAGQHPNRPLPEIA